MESSVVTSTEEFKNLEAAWSALLEKSSQDNIFLDFNWLFSRWQNLKGKNHLFIVIIRDKDEIAGIAPFMLFKKGGLPTLAFIGTGVSDYEDIITSGDQQKREGIVSAVINALQKNQSWSAFHLKGIRADSLNLPAFKKLFSLQGHRDGAPYIGIERKWEEYCAGLRKKLVSDSKRQKNRLESDHPGMSFEHITDVRQAHGYLDKLAGFHREIRKKKKTKSIFENHTNMAFFREAIDTMLPQNKLVFSVLKSGRQIAALHMGFSYCNTFYYYLPAYNPLFAKYSIGRLLLAELVKYAFTSGFRRFDFMLGQEDYKEQWTTENTSLYFINAFSSRPAGRMAMAISAMKLKAKKALGRKW